MTRLVCLLCASYLLYTGLPWVCGQPLLDTGQVVNHDDPTGNFLGPGLARPEVQLRGLCRDGWNRGKMRDMTGKETPVCLKINSDSLTWQEAQQSCRRNYGFLLKLDSAANVDDRDLFAAIYGSGITKFWTGLHTSHDHLVWDDIIPNNVRPHNMDNKTNQHQHPRRPWNWEKSLLEDRETYCGQMNINILDDDRKRRRRSPDDDDGPINFDLSKFQNNPFGNAFSNPRRERPSMAEALQSLISRSPINRQPNLRSNGRMRNSPRASAFQSMLSRTPSIDMLDELPSTSFGMQSDPQIPGTGLVETNLEKGGLSSLPVTPEPPSESDDTSPLFDNSNLGSSEGSTGNSDQGLLANVDNLGSSDGNDATILDILSNGNDNNIDNPGGSIANILDAISNGNDNNLDNSDGTAASILDGLSNENDHSMSGELLDAVRDAANKVNELSDVLPEIPSDPEDILKSKILENEKSLGNTDTLEDDNNGHESEFNSFSTTMSPIARPGMDIVNIDGVIAEDHGNERDDNIQQQENENGSNANDILAENDEILDKLLSDISKVNGNDNDVQKLDIQNEDHDAELIDKHVPFDEDTTNKDEKSEQLGIDSVTDDLMDKHSLTQDDSIHVPERNNGLLEDGDDAFKSDSINEGIDNILDDKQSENDRNSLNDDAPSELLDTIPNDFNTEDSNNRDAFGDISEFEKTFDQEVDHETDQNANFISEGNEIDDAVEDNDTFDSSVTELPGDVFDPHVDDINENSDFNEQIDGFEHDAENEEAGQDINGADLLEILQKEIMENDDIGVTDNDREITDHAEPEGWLEGDTDMHDFEHKQDDTGEGEEPNNDLDNSWQNNQESLENDNTFGTEIDSKDDIHDMDHNGMMQPFDAEESDHNEHFDKDLDKEKESDGKPQQSIDAIFDNNDGDLTGEDGLSSLHDDLHETLEQETVREMIDADHEEGHDDIKGVHDETDEFHGILDTSIDSAESSINDTDDRDENSDEVIEGIEDVSTGDSTDSALELLYNTNTMELSSCKQRLPSVCFTYEVEVVDKASTCDNGWYGHVLLDTCYRIVDKKYDYADAVSRCASYGARLVLSDSQFERNFVLLAVHHEGKRFRGGRFWMETPVSQQRHGCDYFDERGVHQHPTCKSAMHVVCVKDAKPLPVFHSRNTMTQGGLRQRDRVFTSRSTDNQLQCELNGGASEFPVLWFKDGILVATKDTYLSTDTNLLVNKDLLYNLNTAVDKHLELPALQGRYWCEIWDRNTITRQKSSQYNVRFSDVITFHGSMDVAMVTQQEEVLFNMMHEQFAELQIIETDLRKVFSDVLPVLQKSQPEVTNVYTYVDKIRSHPSVVEYHTYFVMSRDVEPYDEDAIYAKIKSVLRAHLGNKKYMASLPGQTTIATFRTMSLQSTVSCLAASLQTNRDILGNTGPARVFSFPKAMLGDFANSVDTCSPTNQMPAGTARCVGDFYTGAYWGEVVANECVEEVAIDSFNQEVWGASPFTDKLTEMAQTPVDASNVALLIDEVSRISNVAVKFTPTDINKIADVFDHTTQVGSLGTTEGQAMVETVDKLMTSNRREAHIANIETKAANRIIKSVERFAENANLHGKKNVRVVSENVVVEIWDLEAGDKPVIGLAAESHMTPRAPGFTNENIATIYNSSHLIDANVDAAIELPVEVFSKREKGKRLTNRLTMMVFRKNQLFEAAVSDNGRTINPTDEQFNNLNSYVISASIAGKRLSGLKERVKTIFKPLKDGDGAHRCVWWDFDLHNEKGGWSQEGCVYDGRVNGRDVCLCNHLTNFAVLLDFYGQAERIPDEHDLSLSIITILGLSCSIIGLCLTIISYVFFRKLRKGRAQQTLFNLSLALLFSMLIFLVGIKQTHNYWGCIGVAMLLHYFILASFMWMLMEAILQYLTFVKILGTYITRFTLKTVIPAWGLPLIPVIAVLSVDYNLYKGGPYYCWMDLPAFYYAFIIPVSLIILVNVIIFVVTVVSIFRRGKGLRSNQKKHKMAVTNLQAAITSFVLLGLTWLFGYLAISDARLPFQYIFTILNSLQGFFIFILFVLRKKKVREQWYIICCKPGERDRVSRTLSASNSSYSNSSNRNSRNRHERDRSDSTKTVQSTYSNSSDGFTNFGYDHGFDMPYNRSEKRAFRKL